MFVDRASVHIVLKLFPMSETGTKNQMQPQKLNLLTDALTEAQTTVRAYDTKAQIVGVGYAFALGIVAGTSDWFPKASVSDLLPILVFWFVIMTPLLLFGYVLYPSRKTAPHVDVKSEGSVKHVLYVDTGEHKSLKELRDAVDSCDPANEIMFELLKVSKLRELKRQRFVRALITAAFSFFSLFAFQVLEALR
ncbi:MAG: hypothetical protein ACR2O3_13830 [Rhizobiaceae bacterium]